MTITFDNFFVLWKQYKAMVGMNSVEQLQTFRPLFFFESAPAHFLRSF